jgi:membrane-associated protein
MPFARFIGFSISGGILWVVTLSMAGYYFNQIEFVRTHFQLVVLAIVGISLLPMVVHALGAGKRGAVGEAIETEVTRP